MALGEVKKRLVINSRMKESMRGKAYSTALHIVKKRPALPVDTAEDKLRRNQKLRQGFTPS